MKKKIIGMLFCAVFAGFAQASVDGSGTLSLWHMDNLTTVDFYAGTPGTTLETRSAVADDDSIVTGRNHDLAFGSVNTGGSTYSPALSADGLGHTGTAGDRALVFSGAQTAVAPGAWPSIAPQNFKIDFYMNVATAKVATLAMTVNTFEIRQQQNAVTGLNELIFYIYDTGPTKNIVSTSFSLNEWDHVEAWVLNGSAHIALNGVEANPLGVSVGTLQNPLAGHERLVLGSRWDSSPSKGRFYDGMLDEVKIVPEPATMILLGLGLAFLRRKN
ncbi:MAG: hypothetical protein A2Y10_19950 [Planctomycetes bacterium GWF2_41_51]|nr:MAG: hypothetical protein A2Y10_19950 [Planctomycetes bacterium GWF2_41_51]HBG28559.1 hypothetical protein [Phycisphaerales bacterium]